MSTKLTDTQLVMLSAAAQREDRCVTAPPNVRGAAAHKIATKLIAAGLVKEIKAKPGAQVWRRDDPTGQAYALKLTPTGLKAIAVEETETVETDGASSTSAPPDVATNVVDPAAMSGSVARQAANAGLREGSKLALVVDLLRREDGATVGELSTAMGWLPHTTRAALTGLRKRGFGIDRRKAEDKRASAYLIPSLANAAQG